MSTSRAHITFPKEVRADLDQLVDRQHRSKFVTEAVRKELLLLRQREALRVAAGSWKDKDHPELKNGVRAWVKKLRQESEVRFKKQFHKRWAMNPFLLDTNIIVNVFRRRGDALLLVENLLSQGQPLASCPVTITEVYAGMRPHEEKATRAFMKTFVFLSVNAEIAEQAGHLKRRYAKGGKALSFQDATIAAISIAYGCTLVTENIKDFPLPELQLYPLSKAA
jgi:predicted nucleic acid-binding protein